MKIALGSLLGVKKMAEVPEQFEVGGWVDLDGHRLVLCGATWKHTELHESCLAVETMKDACIPFADELVFEI